MVIKAGQADSQILTIYGRAAYALGDVRLANQAGKMAWDMERDNFDAEALYKLTLNRAAGVNLPSALGKVGLTSADQINPSGQADLAGPGGGWSGSGMTAAEIAAAAARQAAASPSKVSQSAAFTREAARALTVQDYQAAHTIAGQAIDLNPRNAQAWNYRAIADNKLGRFGEGVYDASFALGLAPGNAAALQTRSWAFNKQKKYKEGLGDANYTLEVEPNNAFAFQNRAFALAGLGDREGALEALRRSAELDPRFKDRYDAALQAPQGSDLLFLFDDQPAASLERGPVPASPRRRFLRLALLSLTGGLLVALGLLHTLSSRFRQTVRSTLRRVLGSGAAPADGAAPAEGFWGGYELARELGSGGMGVVYEARDRALDRRVAIKKMRDELRADPVERQRFVTEARTVAALHHPGIVDIFSIVEDGSDVYIVFEYVSGRTLHEVLREKGSLEFNEAKRLLRAACEAVEYAHRQRVIHRDLKPSNIMLADDGQVKVMDFGVARQAKDAVTKMATNTIVGTPPYMAPEQEQGTVRRESDVFALGVLLYEMLSGQLPFTGQGAGMLLNKINGRHVPISQKAVRGAPAGLDAVLSKVLSPDPDKRYRSPAEFMAAVDALTGVKPS